MCIFKNIYGPYKLDDTLHQYLIDGQALYTSQRFWKMKSYYQMYSTCEPLGMI